MRASCHVGACTPFVMLMIGAARSTSFHISRAVSPCSSATPFASRDEPQARDRHRERIAADQLELGVGEAEVRVHLAHQVELVDLVACGHRRVRREHDMRA